MNKYFIEMSLSQFGLDFQYVFFTQIKPVLDLDVA